MIALGEVNPRDVRDMMRFVHSRMDDGADYDDAVLQLHRKIGNDEHMLAAFWSALGKTALRFILRDQVPANGRLKSIKSSSGSSPAPRPSWRHGMTPTGGLDMVLPVGGERKAVRDFTCRDIEALEELYRGMAGRMTVRAEQWGRLRRAMAVDDTVGTAMDAGRVKKVHLGFLEKPSTLDGFLTAGEEP